MRKALILAVAGLAVLAACERRPEAPRTPSAPDSGPTSSLRPSAPLASANNPQG